MEYNVEKQVMDEIEWDEDMERDSFGIMAGTHRNDLILHMYVNYMKHGFKFTVRGTYEYKDIAVRQMIKNVEKLKKEY